MADSVLTDLTGLTSPADGDVLYIVDISDTTESTAGTERKITVSSLLSGVSFTDMTIVGTNTITAADGENGIALTVTQNDTTNNPTALDVTNAGTGTGVDIDQTGNGTALEVDNDGTGHGVHIHQDGVSAANDNALYVYSVAAQINSHLVKIHQDNNASTKDAVRVQNDGTGYGMYIDQNGNGIPLCVDNVGTSTGIHVIQTGVLSSAHALYVYSNAVQNASPLSKIHQDNASSDQDVVQVVNDGTGKGFYVDQNGNGVGFTLENAGTNHGMYINQAGVNAANDHALFVGSNATQVNSSLVRFLQDNASSNKEALIIKNDGTGDSVKIVSTGASRSIYLDTSQANDGVIVNITPEGTSPSAFLVARNDDVTGNIVLRLGGSYIWVDATGDLRIKTSAPTGDTDGVIVGTQS